MIFRVFDMTKPTLSDEAERDVEAKTMLEAVEKIATLKPNQYIRRVKSGSARFVVYNPNARKINKYLFEVFNN